MINGLKITDVAVFPIKAPQEGSKLKAYAKVTLNEQLVLSNIRVVHGSKGLFLGMPQNYNKEEGKGYDIFFPLTADLRDYITSEVIRKYRGAGEESQVPEEDHDGGPQVDEFMEGTDI